MRLLPFLAACALFQLAHAPVWASQTAQQLFDAGQYEQALGEVNQLLDKDRNNPQARFMKGLILVQQGKEDQAVQIFTQLTVDYPDLPEPYNNLAVIYAGQGKYDQARDALQAALKTHPSYTTAYVNLGDIYAKLASEAYQQALELDKKDSQQVKVKLALIDELFPGRELPDKMAISQPAKAPEQAQTSKTGPVIRPTTAKADPEPPAPTTDLSTDKRQLLNDLKGWAAAWSAQDVNAYLSYYDADFKPDQGTAIEWRRQRHVRLSKPKFIKVTLTDLQVGKLSSSTAEVTLKQRYEADHYKDVTKKQITLTRHSDGWKILQETVLF